MVHRNREQKMFYYSQQAIYNRKIEELDTAEGKVAWLLFHNVHLRNCDKCLIHHYWSSVDGLKSMSNQILPEVIHSLTSSETIRRVRQHIQNDLGLFLPTEQDVIDAREISSDAVKDWVVREKNFKGD